MKHISIVLVIVTFMWWALIVLSFFFEFGLKATAGLIDALTFRLFSIKTCVLMSIALGVVLSSISFGMLWESHK